MSSRSIGQRRRRCSGITNRMNHAQCSAVRCRAAPCSAVQRRAAQCSAVQCSAVQCVPYSAAPLRAVQCRAAQCSAVQCRAAQRSAVQCWEVPCSACKQSGQLTRMFSLVLINQVHLGHWYSCSCSCVFYSSSWHPASLPFNQAIGRIRRYGQKKVVNIYRFLASDTIDTDIYEVMYSYSWFYIWCCCKPALTATFEVQ